MKTGRPKVEINWTVVDEMCAYRAYEKDIAFACGVSEDTLENKIREKENCTFSEYRDKRLGPTRKLLITRAIEVAMQGNVSMMIFCLKNLCGWCDSPPEIANKDGNKEIKINISEDDDKL